MNQKAKRTIFFIALAIIVCMILYGLLSGRGDIKEWSFCEPEAVSLWEAVHDIDVYGWDSGEKTLKGGASGRDPYLILREVVVIDSSRIKILMLEAKFHSKEGIPHGYAQFYWAGREGEFNEAASAVAQLRVDGRYRRYYMDLSEIPEWHGMIQRLRCDPLNQEGAFSVKRIRLGPKNMRYYLCSTYDRLSAQNRVALLLFSVFIFYACLKRAFESLWPESGITGGLQRIAQVLPPGILLLFFFLISLVPFSHYPGWRFRILGADCLFPSLLLIPALLILFLGRDKWSLVRILVALLFLFFLAMLAKATGTGPLDGWRLAGLGMTVGLLVIAIWRERGDPFTLFHAALLLFVATAFLSSLLQQSTPASRFFLLNFYLPPLILFALASDILKDHEKSAWFFKGMILAGVFVAVYAIIEYFFGHVLLSEDFYWKYAGAFAGYGGIRRTGSTLIQPLVLTSYFLALLPLCGYFLKKANTALQKFFLGTAFALFLMALFLAKSRTGWILCGIVLFIAFAGRRKHIYIVLFSLVVVLLAEFFMFFYAKKHGGQPPTQEIPYESAEGRAIREGKKEDYRVPEAKPTGERYFVTQRLAGLKTAVRILREHPLFGIGPGNFRAYSQEHELSEGQEGHRVTPENMYLMLAAETGTAGFFLFIAILWAGMTRLFRGIRSGGPGAGMNRVMLAAAAGLLLHMLFYDMLYWYVVGALFWMIAGFSGGLAAHDIYRKEGR